MLNHKDKLDSFDAIEGMCLVYNGKHKRLERWEGIDRENVSTSRDKTKSLCWTRKEPSFNRRLNIKRFENMHFVFWVTDNPRDQAVYLWWGPSVQSFIRKLLPKVVC